MYWSRKDGDRVLDRAGRQACLTKRARSVFICGLLFASLIVTTTLWMRLYSYTSPDYQISSADDEFDDNKISEAAPVKRDFILHPRDHVFREPQTQTHLWRVTTDYLRPDGVLKSVYLINGEFPGPTIETRPGDSVIIEVENALDNEQGLILQWHGLSLRENDDIDAVSWVPESPIMPGQSLIYNLTIDSDRHGTFWYSAQDETQRDDGLYGAFIIHNPTDKPNEHHLDKEHLLLIGDWHHGSTESVSLPESILLNGVGSFDCDRAESGSLDCEEVLSHEMMELHLTTAKRNILRVINVGSYGAINLTIHGSDLTILSVNGKNQDSKKHRESTSVISSKERVHILVELGSIIADFHSSLRMSHETPRSQHGIAESSSIQQFPVHWLGDR